MNVRERKGRVVCGVGHQMCCGDDKDSGWKHASHRKRESALNSAKGGWKARRAQCRQVVRSDSENEEPDLEALHDVMSEGSKDKGMTKGEACLLSHR